MNLRSFFTAAIVTILSAAALAQPVPTVYPIIHTPPPILMKTCSGSLGGAVIPAVHTCEGFDIRTGYGEDLTIKVKLTVEATLHVDADPLDPGSTVKLVFSREDGANQIVLARKTVPSGAYVLNCIWDNGSRANCSLVSLPLSPYGQYRELARFSMDHYGVPTVDVKVTLGSQSMIRKDLVLGKG